MSLISYFIIFFGSIVLFFLSDLEPSSKLNKKLLKISILSICVVLFFSIFVCYKRIWFAIFREEDPTQAGLEFLFYLFAFSPTIYITLKIFRLVTKKKKE